MFGYFKAIFTRNLHFPKHYAVNNIKIFIRRKNFQLGFLSFSYFKHILHRSLGELRADNVQAVNNFRTLVNARNSDHERTKIW